MMLHTTAGQLVANNVLPADLRDQSRVLDKKGISQLLQKVAQLYPDRYREIAHELSRVGYHTAQMTGGNSFGLEHMRLSLAGRRSQIRLGQEVQKIYADRRLDDAEKTRRVVGLLHREREPLEEAIYKESLAERNPLALQVLSGARGNKTNLRSLRGGDLLYVDHHDNPIPIPILHSYSQGFSPVEYYAGTFGARKGVSDVKFATQDAGFFCLDELTPVRMADGSEATLKDIQVDDWVLGADATGRTFPVRVSAVSVNGLREVYRHRFRVGKSRNGYVSVAATADHKVLAKIKRGRSPTRSVLAPTMLPFSRCGVGFRLVLSTGFVDTGLQPEPRAGILGLLLAEGGLTGNNTNFSTGDPLVVSAVERELSPLGFRVSKRNGKEYEYTVHDEQPIRKTWWGPAKAGSFRDRLRGWLSELGLLRKLASAKFMPACVATWDNASVALLLAFLFEGDGWVAETNHSDVPVIGLGMTARPVVEAARDLLSWRFGVHATPVTEGERDTNNVFILQIATRRSVERFAEHIPMPGVKGQKLAGLLAAARPPVRDDAEFLYSYVSKEYLGLRPTRDLEVDHPDHLFVLANGAIVSNSKQMTQATHRLVVTAHDADRDPVQARGLPVDTDDPDNEGALLAHPAGGYPRNTLLTPKILADLRSGGHERILVRSPLAGGPPDGGLYARDVGVREKGGLSPVGDYVGIAAAQALSEPLAQAQLSSKHSGGIAGAAKGVSGFKLVNQLVQVPSTFKGGAAHAEVDGRVQHVEPAPQGGSYVTVAGRPHYVGTGYDVRVKPGDDVEAGDVLSDGIPNPAKVVEHKGVGEGARYFVEAFRKAYQDSGITAHRRNIEVAARGLINHVRVRDEFGDHVPGDVVPYTALEHSWRPRPGHTVVDPGRARGMYLEQPVLHYSIGTKVRPSVAENLRHFGVGQVVVHPDPPPFEPEMIRGMENLAHDPDWMTRFLGSYLEKNLLRGARRGAESDAGGTSYVPALAEGVSFGRAGKTVGWKPGSILKPPPAPANP